MPGESELPLEVAVERLPHGSDLPLPAYATDGAAGLDLLAAATLTLGPGARATMPTGLRIVLPVGFEGQIRPRSGLAARDGVSVLNAPGTIDADYRGEIKVLLINLGARSVALPRGSRIAQLVIAPVTRIAWREDRVDEAGTRRGSGGFGSTG